MCGSENRLYKSEIEGTVLNVCKHCAKYGKIIGNVHDKKWVEKFQKKREIKSKLLLSKEQISQAIVEDFAGRIKKKREALGMRQEDFAKKINEKVSLIHKIETGSFEPNINLARKIERFLKIRLIEQVAPETSEIKKTKSGSFTLGDFIKIKE
ncbi:TIGR00270 family protein [Candidatus Woesearchaeota archaeon]|nr:TIGR00270 family protein [Candidatus Woesearchaeota archaeon]